MTRDEMAAAVREIEGRLYESTAGVFGGLVKEETAAIASEPQGRQLVLNAAMNAALGLAVVALVAMTGVELGDGLGLRLGQAGQRAMMDALAAWQQGRN